MMMKNRLVLSLGVLLYVIGCHSTSGSGRGTDFPTTSLCSSPATLHEGHFAADASLTADFSGTTLLHLGPNDEDTIPFHVASQETFDFDLQGDLAESAVLKDAAGNVLWASSPEDEAMNLTLTPGDYTLTITNADTDEGVVVIEPADCALAASSSALSLKSAASVSSNAVYVGDLPAGTHVINGVSTGTAAFVGFTPQGPANVPTLVMSYDDFSSQFGDVGDLGNDNLVAFSVRSFFDAGGSAAWIVRIPPDDNGRLPLPAAYVGDPAVHTGLHALDAASGFNQLVIPDLIRWTSAEALPVIQAGLDYAKESLAFFIVDPQADLTTPAQLLRWAQGLPSGLSLHHGALYFPKIQVQTPSGALRTIGAGGAMAGIYASTDEAQGVWVAPAGFSNGRIMDAVGLPYKITDDENSDLNNEGLNAIRLFPIYGITAWGARTLEGVTVLNSDYQYISVRRLALFIESSLQQGLRWTVFEPNNQQLWSMISQSVTAFMQNLQNQGAFYDFVVQCDATTTTQFDMDEGVVNVIISFAPTHPAEFLVLYLPLRSSLNPSE